MGIESGGERTTVGADLRPDGGHRAAPTIGVDGALTVLDHPRRRFIVRELVDNASVKLQTLAERMAAAERAAGAGAPDPQAVERGRISIIHVHVPVLTAHDAAVHDRASSRLRAGPNTHHLADALVALAGLFEAG